MVQAARTTATFPDRRRRQGHSAAGLVVSASAAFDGFGERLLGVAIGGSQRQHRRFGQELAQRACTWAFVLLMVVLMLGNPVLAQSEGLRATVDRPETATAAADRLAAAIGSGQAQQALIELQQRIDEAPENVQFRFLQARALAALGRNTEARQAYEVMTERFPELPEPHNNLAVLMALDGAWDQARAALETAVRTDPGYRTAWENLGDVYARQALQAYETAQTISAARGESGTQALKHLSQKIDLAQRLIEASAIAP